MHSEFVLLHYCALVLPRRRVRGEVARVVREGRGERVHVLDATRVREGRP